MPSRQSTTAGVTRTMPAVSGGAINAALQALGKLEPNELREEAADGATGPEAAAALGFSRSLGCDSRNTDDDVRVNQDCTFRRQAETGIAFDPTEPDNLVAGQNDSRVGFNQCGIAVKAGWSTRIVPGVRGLCRPIDSRPVRVRRPQADPRSTSAASSPSSGAAGC